MFLEIVAAYSEMCMKHIGLNGQDQFQLTETCLKIRARDGGMVLRMRNYAQREEKQP
jgi:hypothetical protein